ncbi:MAG: hypothetical protein ABFD60_06055 [Bryobacteraceae bacterium]
MSDYMFMLENHLSTPQSRVVKEIQSVAEQCNVNLFLTGGAVRDMLGGFPIRDLDFTVEGNAQKVAKLVSERAGAELIGTDLVRKTVELRFPGRVRVEVGMSRIEKRKKPGGTPHISPATIAEDLRERDFTINSLALSLNRASLGLLLDPNNGTADLEQRVLRAVHGRVFLSDPGRLLRLVRFRVRFGLTVEERTQGQYENARLEQLETYIEPRRLFGELWEIAEEANPAEVLQALQVEKLLSLYGEALAGPNLNIQGLAKLQKARQAVPFGVDIKVCNFALLLYLLMERLTPPERTALIKATDMQRREADLWRALEVKSKKLEKSLGAAALQKPSRLYQLLSASAGEEILFLLMSSQVRLVHDRIKNYLQKYLPAAQEVTDADVAATGVEPGTPKFRKAKEELIAARLDGRIRKPAAPEPEEKPAAVPPARGAGRPGRAFSVRKLGAPKGHA